MLREIMPKTKLPHVISEVIIDFEDNSNVLVRYFVSPTFQLRVESLQPIEGNVTTQYSQRRIYDKKDTLDIWLRKNTIPYLALGISSDIKSHLFFGGAPHQLSFCRIAEQKVFDNYGAIGPAAGAYYRIVEVLAMPEEHGLPSRILDEFSLRDYTVVDKEHSMVKRSELV